MLKYAKWAALAMVVWYIISRPAGAADVVHQAAQGLTSAANSLTVFIGGVLP
ncbi:hypothetical protein J4573_40670 [Actinomadura barringtoniae]|uniref:Uncharacterized protein n=1 Tax=Actinomadura barringtoniae TaxID=1427535 RepID=A0A939PP06_9ACTN|nr:hypothetical protein [Actinomadura barringtoniae]MBO2453464.1 hypothetical protein [Actinomadura barringtoniae]